MEKVFPARLYIWAVKIKNEQIKKGKLPDRETVKI